MADWSRVEAAGVDITVFSDTIHDEKKLVDRLKPCESRPQIVSLEVLPEISVHGDI
jgi:hypothetical protein